MVQVAAFKCRRGISLQLSPQQWVPEVTIDIPTTGHQNSISVFLMQSGKLLQLISGASATAGMYEFTLPVKEVGNNIDLVVGATYLLILDHTVLLLMC